MNQYEREKWLLRYLDALDAPDLDTLSQIVALAETDARLSVMLQEVHVALDSPALTAPLVASTPLNGHRAQPRIPILKATPLAAHAPSPASKITRWAAVLMVLLLGGALLRASQPPATDHTVSQVLTAEGAARNTAALQSDGVLIAPENVHELVWSDSFAHERLARELHWNASGLLLTDAWRDVNWLHLQDGRVSQAQNAQAGFGATTGRGRPDATAVTSDDAGNRVLVGYDNGQVALHIARVPDDAAAMPTDGLEAAATTAGGPGPVREIALDADSGTIAVRYDDRVMLLAADSLDWRGTLTGIGHPDAMAYIHGIERSTLVVAAAGWLHAFDLREVDTQPDAAIALPEAVQVLDMLASNERLLVATTEGTILAADTDNVIAAGMTGITDNVHFIVLRAYPNLTRMVGRDGLVAMVNRQGELAAFFSDDDPNSPLLLLAQNQTMAPITTVRAPRTDDWLAAMAVAPGGQRVAYVAMDGTTAVVDLEGDNSFVYHGLLGLFPLHARLLGGSIDDPLVAVRELDALHVYALDGQQRWTLPGTFTDIALHAWAQHDLLTMHYVTNIISAWDIADGQRSTIYAVAPQHIGFDNPSSRQLQTSADGRMALVIDHDNVPQVLNLATREIFLLHNAPSANGSAYALSPAGRTVAVATRQERQGLVVLLDTRTDTVLAELPIAQVDDGITAVNDLIFSPDGRLLALTTNRWLYVVNLDTGVLHIADWVEHPRSNLAFSADGRLLAFAQHDPTNLGMVHLISTAPTSTDALIPLQTLHHGHAITGLAFTADGQTLVTSTADQRIHTWALARDSH